MNRRIITILIAGAVFTAGLIMGFGGYVFAGDPVEGMDITIKQNPGGRISTKNYNSSISNKSIGQVRMEVGDVLLRYGFGGKYINQVTEALEGNGVDGAELKWFFIAIGLDETEAQNILLEFDKIGISGKGAEGVSTPSAGGAVPSPSTGTLKELLPSGISPGKRAEPAPATTLQQHSAETGEERFKSVDGLDSETRSGGFIKLGDLPGKRAAFKDSAIKSIQDLKAAESKEQRENITKELKYRRVLLQQGVQTLRQDLRENAQELRDNFRKNVGTIIGHVDHGKTARIAIAHGKGLRMINRYRSAIARFDHILGRLESRIQKLEAQGYPANSLFDRYEEGKNMQIEAEAKLEELKVKYESLLLGENAGGAAKEAREIAKELKSEIEKLHGLLNDIKQASVDYNSSRSNVKL